LNTRYDVIIVGGGVNGCAAAYYLSRQGKKVLLLEKESLAGKASSAAAGMLGAQVEVTDEGPLFAMAKESRAMFPSLQFELKEHSGIDIELLQEGMLKIARTDEEVSHLKRTIQYQKTLGERAEWLNTEEVLGRESSLSKSILGAMDIPMDGHVNPEKLTLAFAGAAVQFGADIKEYVEVDSFKKKRQTITGVETSEGTFSGGHVVVAAGAWSKRLLAKCEMDISAYPVKGECFSVLCDKPIITSTIFTESCYLVPKKGNRLVVGATMVPHTFSEKVSAGGLSSLMREAQTVLPDIKYATFERAWAGIRPQTGDGLPYLGKHPDYQNLIIAAGHFRNGILLSPITGSLVAKLVLNEHLPPYFEAFSLNRLKDSVKR
jgi:glycine oxidase